jgi:hypothetical protein
MMIPKPSFHIEGPLASYCVTGDSGKPVTRWHCAKCASGVGSLDDASWVVPQMHIYTSARQPWLKIGDGLPQYEKAPEG